MRDGRVYIVLLVFLAIGLPLAKAASAPQVFTGPIGNQTAKTELIITNRDPLSKGGFPGGGQPQCRVGVLFLQGPPTPGRTDQEVLFNGQEAQQNFFDTTIPVGGATILTLTPKNPEELVIGAVPVVSQRLGF